MKTYNITPSLNGVLSDDELYFEGLKRPPVLFTMRDHGDDTEENLEILEKYFSDIYNLFLRKLSIFATEDTTSHEESLKLQALLQEMIKVKGLLESGSKAADQRSAD